jgi:Skp family chaperone for outer membrane proteins
MKTFVPALLFLVSSLAAQEGSPLSKFVGFVDMERIVREHPQTKIRLDKLEQETNEALQKLKNDFDRAKASESGLDTYAEGSPEYISLLTRIRQERAEIEINRKAVVARLNIESVNVTRDTYNLCRGEIGRLAQELKLSVVAMYSSSDVKGQSRAEVLTDIITRPFIYHDSSLDITEQVLARIKK